MKLSKVVAAYAALLPLCEREWDYQTAYQLLALRRALTPHAAFFAEREAALAAAFGKKDSDGKVRCDNVGRFSLDESASPEEYRARYLALASVEITPDWQPVTVCAEGKITPVTIDALTDFVTFTEGEEESCCHPCATATASDEPCR